MDSQEAQKLHRKMVQTQIRTRGILDKRVISAMLKVPRHVFGNFTTMEEAYGYFAYIIDCEQTSSQPYVVALMTEALQIESHHKLLEIGTGSGYQTAILAELAQEIYTIERHQALLEIAQNRLLTLGYANIQFKLGQGEAGWGEASPFDRIMVTAAAAEYPKTLIDQLSTNGGVIIFPLGQPSSDQVLLKIVRHSASQFKEINLGNVRFVPLIVQSQNAKGH